MRCKRECLIVMISILITRSSTPGRQEEPITLSSDDEGGANGEAIVLGGEPEAEVCENMSIWSNDISNQISLLAKSQTL